MPASFIWFAMVWRSPIPLRSGSDWDAGIRAASGHYNCHGNGGPVVNSRKAIIIGWDGAPWEYLNPLLDAQRLPNLSRLLARGSRAALESTIPPFTNVAWPAMVTGLTPAHTGVFDGSKAPIGTYKAIPTNLIGFRGTPIWHWLNRHGYRTAILNVPMTYPAPPLDGICVSGFDSPARAPDAFYPRDLLQRWTREGHPYTVLEKEIALMASQNPHHERGSLEPFVQGWIELSREQGGHVARLWQENDLDFLLTVFSGSDSINHRTREFDQIARVYEALDGALGEILAVISDDTLVCLLSDHGSTPAFRYVSLFHALSEGGWLKFKPAIADHYFRRLPVAGSLAMRFWQRLPESLRKMLSFPILALDDRLAVTYENIDWPNTSAYARTGMGLLYVNHHGSRPEGSVSPMECRKLLDDLRAYFLTLRDDEGIALFADVLYGSELYPGADPVDDPPDLLLRPARWSDHLITGFPSDPLVREIPDSREYGAHSPTGVLVLAGPDVRTGHDLGRGELIDVVPTVLALMGLPVPRTVDGHVLKDASTSPLSVQHVDDLGPSEKRSDFTDKEARELSKRLEDLGYL